MLIENIKREKFQKAETNEKNRKDRKSAEKSSKSSIFLLKAEEVAAVPLLNVQLRSFHSTSGQNEIPFAPAIAATSVMFIVCWAIRAMT